MGGGHVEWAEIHSWFAATGALLLAARSAWCQSIVFSALQLQQGFHFQSNVHTACGFVPTLTIGGLAAGETREVRIPFVALDDGREQVSWGASGIDPTTGNGVKGNGKLVVRVNPDYLASIEKTQEEFETDLETQSQRSVKVSFVLDELARAENLSVNQAELSYFVADQAQRMGMSPEHFARQPIMPGTLVVEAMAQVAGWLVNLSLDFRSSAIMSIVQGAALHEAVRPGDQLLIQAEIIEIDKRSAWARCQASTPASAEIARIERIMFALYPLTDPAEIEHERRRFAYFSGYPR